MDPSLRRDLKDNQAAVEKVIDMINEQQDTINTLTAAFDVMKLTITAMKQRLDELRPIVRKVDEIEQQLSTMEQRVETASDKLQLVTLDSGADHMRYDHNQDLVEQWKMDMAAGIEDPELQREDIEDRTVAFNDRRSAHGMHRLYNS